MEYPFKDLMPLDEVLEREGYYKDWTHLDPKVFYSLTQISEYIKTKGYGVDVRLLIAQLAEHLGLKTTQVVDLANLLQNKFDNLEGVTSDFTSDINGLVAQMEADKDAVIANATVDSEVILARGGKPTLAARLDETTAQLAQKASKQQLEYHGINVKDFGAIGDGVADDTVAINEAVAYANSLVVQEHIPVFFPYGVYRTSGIDIVNMKVNLITAYSGKDGATLTPISPTQTHVIKVGYGGGMSNANYQSIVGFKITTFTPGGLGGNYKGAGILAGVDEINLGEGYIANCWISMGSQGTGIKGRMWDTRIDNCWIDGNRIAIHVNSNSNRVTINQCTFYDNALQHVFFEQATGIPYNGGNGYHRIDKCNFMSKTSAKGTETQLEFHNSQNIQIFNSNFSMSFKKSIRLVGVTNSSIVGCKFFDDEVTPVKLQVEFVKCDGNLNISHSEFIGSGDIAIAYTNNADNIYKLTIDNCYFKGNKNRSISTFSATNNKNEIAVTNCHFQDSDIDKMVRIGDASIAYKYINFSGNTVKGMNATVAGVISYLIGDFVHVKDNFYTNTGMATNSINVNGINVKGFIKNNIFDNTLGVQNIGKSTTSHANLIIDENIGG